ncbi:MAG: type III-A CRISPR-associated RAMP protein Csm4 [Ignavibacteriaceae bacterium]
MNTVILKCKSGTLFRLGEGSLTEVSHLIHSDTLFSAITNIYEMVYENGGEFVKLVEDKKIAFSSAFPALEKVGSDEIIYFVPKPNITFQQTEALGKKEKKIKFISWDAYLKIFEKFIFESLSSNIDINDFQIIDNRYLLLRNELQVSKDVRFINEQIFPKNTVHKENREDAFYFQTDVQLVSFKDNQKNLFKPHFYFFLKHSLNEIEKKNFFTCLRILADEGIGGDRGSGKGYFESVIIKDAPGILKQATNYYMTLSLLNPETQSEFNHCVKYDLIKRGGGSIGLEGKPEYHRKQVRMITEGSILNSLVNGRIVDVSPFQNLYKHKIYRNGKAFLIPLG